MTDKTCETCDHKAVCGTKKYMQMFVKDNMQRFGKNMRPEEIEWYRFLASRCQEQKGVGE